MFKRFRISTGWIVQRRWLTALSIAVISTIAVGGYVAPDSIVEWFKTVVERPDEPNEDQNDRLNKIVEEVDYRPPPRVDTIQLSGYDAIMVVESDAFFTPEGADAIRGVVRQLKSQDYIDEILWMDEIPVLNIFGLNEPLLPGKEAAMERFEISRQKAHDHPLVNGQLLSADGRMLLLMINVNYLFIENDETFTSGMRDVAEAELARHPGVEMKFLVTGKVPVDLAVKSAREENRLKYQVIAYGMIILLSMILFRGATAVFVVALAPFLGVFWTLGFVRYFAFQMNPFNDVVLPILVALVGFTDGVHLMVQIRRERSSGLGPFAAAQEGVRKVGLACFLTSLTTAVGFGSLVLANHELVREFGYCCVIGVALSFLAVVLSIPLVCSTWLGQRIHLGHGKGYIDRNMNRVGRVVEFVLKYPQRISTLGILVTSVCFLTSLTLRPDDRQGNMLPPRSEPAIALQEMDRSMGGLEQAQIGITWNREGEDGNGGAELLTVLTEVHQLLAKEELIGHPISILNLLDALPGEGRIEDRVSLLELLPPSLKRSYYTPEHREALVTFRVQDLGIARYGPVFERIENGMREICSHHENFSFFLSGRPILRWENIYQIVVDLVTSLGTAAVIIFGILAIVFRSLRIGLISIFPNVFPLCVAGTYLVLAGQALEIVTVCAFTCCLGIAVDDTIHFLTRYAEEKKETPDESEAIEKAFTSVGTALVITTLVLVSGFITVLFSDARDHRLFASMGAITVASALVGDLVFLPAILKTFAKKDQDELKRDFD